MTGEDRAAWVTGASQQNRQDYPACCKRKKKKKSLKQMAKQPHVVWNPLQRPPFGCSQVCLVCHLVTRMSCPFPTPTKGTKHTHEAGTKLKCLQTHFPTPSPASILIFFFTYSHCCPSHTLHSPIQAQIFRLSWSLDCWSILLLAQWVINPWPQQRSGQNEQGNNKGRDSWFHLNFPKEEAQLTAKEQPPANLGERGWHHSR